MSIKDEDITPKIKQDLEANTSCISFNNSLNWGEPNLDESFLLVDQSLFKDLKPNSTKESKTSFNLTFEEQTELNLRMEKIDNWIQSILGHKLPIENLKELIYYEEIKTQFEWKKEMLNQLNSNYITRAEQYETKAYSLEKLLNNNNILPNDLSSQANENLNELVEIAMVTDSVDTNQSNLKLAIMHCQQREFEVSSFNQRLKDGLEKVEQQLAKAEFENQALLSTQSKLEREKPHIVQKTKQWQRDIFELKGKSTEYTNRLVDLKDQWRKLALKTKGIQYQDIRQLQQEHEEKEGLAQQLQQQVATFHQLPPDLKLAQLKLEEKTQELDQLIREQEQLVSRILI